MTYSQAFNHKRDSLLDAALEVMHKDLAVQLLVIDEDGTSMTFVGRIDGASVGKNEVIRVSIGETTARVDPAQHWEIYVMTDDDGIRGQTPSHVIVDEVDPVVISWGAPVVHVVRWSNGSQTGYHEAVVLKAYTQDSVIVRFTLDGHEQGVLHSEIRATRKEWEAIEELTSNLR